MDMIVSGGPNIYSKEVELLLAEHAAVNDAAVINVPDEEFSEAVMAFIERSQIGDVSPDELIKHCWSRIASYKKPQHVRFVEALPRTSAGRSKGRAAGARSQGRVACDGAAA